MTNKKIFIQISSIACFIACIGDFAVMYFYDSYFKNYSQIYNTISSLGASNSPVSFEISTWWIVLGFLMIIFGLGFEVAFRHVHKTAKISSWLIILYGIGEGFGSGLFKADYVNNILSDSGKIHDILGGIGITAIFIFILISQKIFTKISYPRTYKLSWLVFISSLLILVLFSFRFSNSETNILALYKGLWQRLLLLDIYIYLLTIAIIMLGKSAAVKN